MAFISMVFASIALIVVVIGLAILLIGLILDVIWGVKKRKQKKVPIVLKGFAVVLTIWGLIQGVGPIAFIGIMNLKHDIEYRAEVSDLPKEAVVHLDLSYDLGKGFDYKGQHYVSDQELHPQSSHDNFKTEKVGAIVFDNDNHYIIEKIINDRDFNILQTGTIYDPYVPGSELNNINDYYKNEAPLYCEVFKDLAEEGKVIMDNIDATKIRAIRDYVQEPGNRLTRDSYEDKDSSYILFYSFDDVYCVDFECIETNDGMIVEYLGDAKVIPDKYADYLRSLFK